MQTLTTPFQAAHHQLDIEAIAPPASEVADDVLTRIAGGLMPPTGDPTYWGEDAFWDPYF